MLDALNPAVEILISELPNCTTGDKALEVLKKAVEVSSLASGSMLSILELKKRTL